MEELPVRIGVHPNNLHLTLASRWPGGLAAGLTFVPYQEGRKSGTLLRDDIIDLCGTGSTPPILAQADGLDVRTLAASAKRPANGSIVVAPGSAIAAIADLRGKRVALLDGSFHTYLLARVLEGAGLGLRDVVRVELSPADSLRRLQTGEVDAWVAMAPLLDSALDDGHVKLLAPCGDLIPNRSIFWTLARCDLTEGEIGTATAALVRLGQAIMDEPETAAKILAEARASDADLAGWRKAITRREWDIVPAGPAILAEQQAEADTLFRHGDLKNPVEVT